MTTTLQHIQHTLTCIITYTTCVVISWLIIHLVGLTTSQVAELCLAGLCGAGCYLALAFLFFYLIHGSWREYKYPA